MKRSLRVTGLLAVFALGAWWGGSVARSQTGVVHVDSAKAAYKEVAPGASTTVVWGDIDKGPFGAFTKFVPGMSNALHTHTNGSRLVVIKGAYVYKPEKGPEKRVGAGEYIFIPGGDRHATGADPKEGALFYQESDGKFDLNFVK
ncbi:MAG TPA: DUF4437 domain-containing protein [Vicinamibacteria bacterium]|nr:DUF4437 domain-containing protein [Vicinamibacteria bacterium]